jgi:hypothetical protein
LPTDKSGSPPAFSNEGTLYADPDVLKNIVKCSSYEDYHASHVMGIAAGSRVKGVHTGIHYSGAATKAELVTVELGGGVISINEALYYMLSYADSVGKPIVVNMSLGSNGGPGDGKRLGDVQISEMLNANPEGRILVVSAGNNGNTKLHIQHKFNDEAQSINVYQRFGVEDFDKNATWKIGIARFDV